MKHFTLILFTLLVGLSASAQTIWTGPTMTFDKADAADWTLDANQDQLTDNVHITRADNQGLFNIASEATYTDFASPMDTEWAFGTTADIETLTFDTWENTNGSNPPSTVNADMVLHLISDDIYIDIKMTYWASGGGGGQGGFTYERSTDSSTSTINLEKVRVNVFPNPASTFIQLEGVTAADEVRVLDAKGAVVFQSNQLSSTTIAIASWEAGIYFVQLNRGPSVRFVKN